MRKIKEMSSWGDLIFPPELSLLPRLDRGRAVRNPCTSTQGAEEKEAGAHAGLLTPRNTSYQNPQLRAVLK